MSSITVRRRRGPDWRFEWWDRQWSEIAGFLSPGYYYQARRRLYRLFVENRKGLHDVWIGAYGRAADGDGVWYTAERAIGATEVLFGRGRYVFR